MTSEKKYYKLVLLPLEVCVGDFCLGDGRVCGNFDNDGGHPTCRFNLSHDLKYDKYVRVAKPNKCKNLRDA